MITLTDDLYKMSDLYPKTYKTMKELPEDIDTSGLTTTEGMFAGCAALVSIPQLDTSSVTNGDDMFSGCKSLKIVPAFDTSSMTTMQRMFNGCQSLPKIFPWVIDLSSVTRLTDMGNVFADGTSKNGVKVAYVQNINSAVMLRVKSRGEASGSVITDAATLATYVSKVASFFRSTAYGNPLTVYAAKEGELVGGYTLPDYASYDSKTSTVTVTAEEDRTRSFSAAKYPWVVLKLDGSASAGAVKLTAGGASAELLAGSGGSTLTGGTGNDTFYGGSGADVFQSASGAGRDTVSGYDSRYDTVKVTSGEISKIAVSDDDMILTSGSGRITVLDSASETMNLWDKRGAFTMTGTTVTLGENFKGTMDVTKYLPTITDIDGSASKKKANITGNGNDNAILAGKAGGTFTGGAGDDTLTGGDGDDVFRFYAGDGEDVIIDYNAGGKDTVKAVSFEIGSVKLSSGDDDVVLTIGEEGIITLEDAASKDINLTDKRGSYKIEDEMTKLTLASNFKGSISAEDLPYTVVTIDGRKTTKKLSLTGQSDDANTIYAGKGGGTLRGGLYDDTLYGGSGKDVFICEGGDDVIEKLSSADSVVIVDSEVNEMTLYDKDIVFTTDGGDILIKGAAKREVSITDSRGSFIVAKATTTAKGEAPEEKITLRKNFGGTMDLTRYLPSLIVVDGTYAQNETDIIGNDNANVIYAGKAGGEITGGLGNDTLIGGKGTDKFIYSEGDGDDIIIGYGSGRSEETSDIISIDEGSIACVIVDGDDVKLNIGEEEVEDAFGRTHTIITGSITLEGMKGIWLTIEEGSTIRRVKYDWTTYDPWGEKAVGVAKTSRYAPSSVLISDDTAALVGDDAIADSYASMGTSDDKSAGADLYKSSLLNGTGTAKDKTALYLAAKNK